MSVQSDMTEMADGGMMLPDSTMMISWRVFLFIVFLFFSSSTFLVIFALSRRIGRDYGVLGMHFFWQSSKHAVDSLLA